MTDCQSTDRQSTDRQSTDRQSTDGKRTDFPPADRDFSQPTHYQRLGLRPSASEREIRQAYRTLSRYYHPDTTRLPLAIAQQQFQQLNEAYATLTRPAQRQVYDQTIGDMPTAVRSVDPQLRYRATARTTGSSTTGSSPTAATAGLPPSDRPLSAGELFVLLLMSLTLMGCLLLAIVVGLSRGDLPLPPEAAREFGFQPLVTTVVLTAPDRVADIVTIPDPTTLPAAAMPPQDFSTDTVTSRIQ